MIRDHFRNPMQRYDFYHSDENRSKPLIDYYRQPIDPIDFQRYYKSHDPVIFERPETSALLGETL